MKNKILLTIFTVLFLLSGCIRGEMFLSCEQMDLDIPNFATYGIRPDEPIVFQSTHPLHREKFLKNLSFEKTTDTGEIISYMEEDNHWCKVEFSNDGKTVQFIPTEKNGWDIGCLYTISFNSPYTVSEDLIHAWRRGVYVHFVPRPEIFYVSQSGTGSPKEAFSWESATSDLQGLLEFLSDMREMRYNAFKSFSSQIWIEEGMYEVELKSDVDLSLDGVGLRGNLKYGTDVIGTGYTLICQKNYDYYDPMNTKVGSSVCFDNDFLAESDGIKEEVFVEDVILKGNFTFSESVMVKNATIITGSGLLGGGALENVIVWPVRDFRYIDSSDVYVASTTDERQDFSLLGVGCKILWTNNDGEEANKDKYPRFVDPDNNDFRLRSDSCLLKTGKDGKNYGGWQGEGIDVETP